MNDERRVECAEGAGKCGKDAGSEPKARGIAPKRRVRAAKARVSVAKERRKAAKMRGSAAKGRGKAAKARGRAPKERGSDKNGEQNAFAFYSPFLLVLFIICMLCVFVCSLGGLRLVIDGAALQKSEGLSRNFIL